MQPVDQGIGRAMQKKIQKKFSELLMRRVCYVLRFARLRVDSQQEQRRDDGEEVPRLNLSSMRVKLARWVVQCWDEVVSSDRLIIGSWRHLGLYHPLDGSRDSELRL